MFSDFCLSSLLTWIIVIIGDRLTGLYYNFLLIDFPDFVQL